MSISFSILIPSKGNARACALTIGNLAGMASHPESVEYIVVIDHNEPDSNGYRRMTDSLWEAGFNVRLLHSPLTGYKAIPAMYQQAYEVSYGDMIFCYNDDCRITSWDWDGAYHRVLDKIPFGVASANCTEGIVVAGGNPGTYPWAFPMLRRDLCIAIGNKLCVGTQVDRVCDAYAALTGRDWPASVNIQHARTLLTPGSDRAKHYAETEANWERCLSQWRESALTMATLVTKAGPIPWPGTAGSNQNLS